MYYVNVYDNTTGNAWQEVFDELNATGKPFQFRQGMDMRLMTEEKAEMIKKIRVKNIHFAWDRFEDSRFIAPRLEKFRKIL